MMPRTDSICFDENNLVPIITQDADTGEVLMLAWGSRESLAETERLGQMVFFSRSRQELWHKGATSGNTLEVVDIRRDCDNDALLALVRPRGPVCHTGSFSCFSSHGEKGAVFSCFAGKLWRYILTRSKSSPEESYTARLLSEGLSRTGQKIGEEGVETAIAVSRGDREAFILEAADLVYHLLVCCLALDVPPSLIMGELGKRHLEKIAK